MWRPEQAEAAVMSPLEAMAKARHDRLRGKAVSWEEAHLDYRAECMREAAADLLALAKSPIPHSIKAHGRIAEAECKSRMTGLGEAFRAMLQAIANQAN
jgi:hypothetical protein